jgi:translocation and assembly module TamA
VLFLDGGSAYESTWPDALGRMLWGAGFGLRYFTPVGPVRVDIAFPLNPREGLDEPFQFYVSLGQTF